MDLLDTDIASYAIKSNSPKVDRKLAAASSSQIADSAIAWAELLYGLKSCRRITHCVYQSIYS